MIRFTPRVHISDFKKFFFLKKDKETLFSYNTKKIRKYLFNRGTIGIRFVCEQVAKNQSESLGRKIRLLLPYYYCAETVEYLRIFFEVDFYNIDADFRPVDFEIKAKQFDVLVVTFYFGNVFSVEKYFNICLSKKSYLLTDMAHCHPLENIPSFSHFSIHSIHKFLPSMEGGLLTVNVKQVNEAIVNNMDGSYELLPRSSSRSIFLKIIISFLKAVIEYLKLKRIRVLDYNSNIKSFNPIFDGYFKISKISEQYLNNVSIDELKGNLVKRLEVEDFIYNLINNIDSWHGLAGKLKGGRGHYCLAVPRSILFKYDVFLPSVNWPAISTEAYENSNSKKLAEEVMLIPLVYDLNLKYLLKIFLKKMTQVNQFEKVEEKIINSKKEFDYYFNQFPNTSLMQNWNYGVAKSYHGWIPVRKLFIDRESKSFVVVQELQKNICGILVRRINRGPVAKSRFDLKLVLDRILKIRFGSILFTQFEIPGTLFYKMMFDKKINIMFEKKAHHTFYLDITRGEEEILKNFDQKWRGHLKNSLKHNIEVQLCQENSIEFFLKEYEKYQFVKKFEGIDTSFLRSLIKVDFNDFIFLNAIQNNHSVGHLAVYVHGKSATYLIGMTNDLGRTLNANYLLLWDVIRILKEKGVDSLDLGGVNYDNQGILSFKQGLNATRFDTVGEGIKFF